MNDGHVSIRKLDKTYLDDSGKPSFQAVKGIDLEIESGEFMVLVGPSGCGKSTTLRMIAGLESITAGTISIGDQVVNELSPRDRGIAMVFQNYALYPHMSVYDNMAFGLKLAKTPKDEIDRRVRDAATILQLEELLDRKPRAMSGGQQQRVAVGRALVRQPKVFLFDEPLSNLDARMRVSTRTEISRLHQRLGATMVYVTHDQIEAMTMGDRITVMKDGHIMQVADPLTLYREPDNMFVAGFIGSPPMNLIKGRIESQGDGLVFTAIGDGPALSISLKGEIARLAEPRIGLETVFGIRPEHAGETHHSEHCAEIKATIDITEVMGEETFAYLPLAGQTLITRIKTDTLREAGGELTVHLDLSKAKLFDPENEQVIR